MSDGLWVLDQIDPNKTFKVRPHDGSIVQELQTESIHGSGITYGNGALWIASTKMTDPAIPPRTLKVDPKSGKTLNHGRRRDPACMATSPRDRRCPARTV